MSDIAKTRARAAEDLQDIETLRKIPAFKRYWERRVLRELSTIRDAVLYDKSLTPETLWQARLKFTAIYECSLMLLQDEAVCRKMTASEEDSE